MAEIDVLACPSCGSEVNDHCKTCDIQFPRSAGIRWMFSNPAAVQFQWQLKIQQALNETQAQIEACQKTLSAVDLLDTMKSKVENLLQAYEKRFVELTVLAEDLDLGMDQFPGIQAVLNHRVPSVQNVDSYFTNIFRDWVWGESENLKYKQILETFLADHGAAIKDIAVFGAGAGRLSYDLSDLLPHARVLHLDLNPILNLIGKKMLDGETIPLTEVVYHPVNAKKMTHTHDLHAPRPPAGPIHVVLADASQPPLKKKSLDAIVSPWIIDVIAEPFDSLVRRWNQFLKPDGVWVNFGPLSFDHQKLNQQYDADSIVKILSSNGFKVEKSEWVETPYLHVPGGAQTRTEKIFCFRAKKVATAKEVKRFQHYPQWMLDYKSEIVTHPSMQMAHAKKSLEAHVLQLLMSQKTIHEVTLLFAQNTKMAAPEAEKMVLTLISNMIESKEIVS